MRLLNVITRQLEVFNRESEVPGGYAILSHTWEEGEVTFDDIVDVRNASRKRGYRKIDYTCLQALRDDLYYVWVDTWTGCIDKRSSAELAEAINSMYRWYQGATICYAYLSDVHFDYTDLPLATLISPQRQFEFDVAPLGLSKGLPDIRKLCWMREQDKQFRDSRWFTRGWTLQELIAPEVVRFYDSTWRCLGNKVSLAPTLHSITLIDTDTLRNLTDRTHKSVAMRMAWASARCTTRLEDRAYCLLGIFDVNIPLLYGEGSKAFLRLQEEIIRTSKADHSILAWVPFKEDDAANSPPKTLDILHSVPFQDLLSSSPYGFRYAHNIVSWALPHAETFALSHNGLKVSLYAKGEIAKDAAEDSEFVDAALNCRYADQPMTHITLYLRKRPKVDLLSTTNRPNNAREEILYDRTYWRSIDAKTRFSSVGTQSIARNFSSLEMTIAKCYSPFPDHGNKVHIPQSSDCPVVVEPFPKTDWDGQHSVLTLGHPDADNRSYGSMMVRLRSVQPGTAEDVNLPIEETYLANIEVENRGVCFRAKSIRQRLTTDNWSVERSASMKPGGTRSIGITGTAGLQVFANYVIMAGEMVWSLSIGASNESQDGQSTNSERTCQSLSAFSQVWSDRPKTAPPKNGWTWCRDQESQDAS